MPDDSVTLALNGDVPVALYAKAIHHFNGLIEALSSELLHKGALDWIVEDLRLGSALATIRAEPREPDAAGGIQRVVEAYASVGQALALGRSIPYSDKVIREAQGIVAVLGGRITSIRFETAEADATIVRPSATPLPEALYQSAYGAIDGRVETLTSRKGLRFTLYDSLYDHSVSCYLSEGDEELMRGVWGRRALVEGWISRDVASGRPVAIRHISAIQPLDEVQPGSYKEARGVITPEPGDIAPEEAIRRVRDAS